MELRLPLPCLVVLVGASSSGKTTWAGQSFEPGQIVSSDRLRGMVGVGEDDQQASPAAFELLERIVTERLGRRLTTVIDTLGFDQSSRQRWVALAHQQSLPAYAVVFDVEPAVAMARNATRPRPVPKTVLDKQLRRFRQARDTLEADGFDAIHAPARVTPVTETISRAIAQPAAPIPAPRDRSGAHGFGLMVSRFDWARDGTDLAAGLISIARRAEAAGFRDLWVMDHFRQIPRVGRAWDPMPEAYVTLSFLAGVTETIRLGAMVTGITHRHPVVLGKMAATLDVVSSGRANLGLGIGWDQSEHSGYGIEFPPVPDRYAMLEDTLRMLPLLWGKGSPAFQGETFTAEELVCYPRPIQERIPITIGGSGENKTLRLVAGYADACNLFGSPSVVRHKVSVLARHCAAVERDPAEIEVTHLVDAMTAGSREELTERIERLRSRNVSAEQFASRHNAGTVEDQVEHFSAYHAAGAHHSVVAAPDLHLEGSIEALGLVIEEMARS